MYKNNLFSSHLLLISFAALTVSVPGHTFTATENAKEVTAAANAPSEATLLGAIRSEDSGASIDAAKKIVAKYKDNQKTGYSKVSELLNQATKLAKPESKSLGIIEDLKQWVDYNLATIDGKPELALEIQLLNDIRKTSEGSSIEHAQAIVQLYKENPVDGYSKVKEILSRETKQGNLGYRSLEIIEKLNKWIAYNLAEIEKHNPNK